MTTTPEPELDEPDDEQETYESWDDFWTEVQAARAGHTETIRGITVQVPADLPMRVRVMADRLGPSSSIDDVKAIVADMFGVDAYDAWVDAGMTDLEFQTVLAWGYANGSGRQATFRQAYEQVVARQGKASSRSSSTRANATSAAGGRSSKRTSSASTASARKRSRG